MLKNKVYNYISYMEAKLVNKLYLDIIYIILFSAFAQNKRRGIFRNLMYANNICFPLLNI